MADTKRNQHSEEYVRQFMPPERRAGSADAGTASRPDTGAPDQPAAGNDTMVISEPTASDAATDGAHPDSPNGARESTAAGDSGAAVAGPPDAHSGQIAEATQPRASEGNGRRPAIAPTTEISVHVDVDAAEPGAPAYVEANDLFKIYKPADLEVVALRGVDLEVAGGELTGIVGASGSGKTTLLNILAGLERPSAGRIRVGDRDLLDISESELVAYRRREVGFVWQATGRNLVPYLNVRDNIELPQAIAGTGRKQRRERATELLDALQMSDKGRRYPSELSGGEQQRVSIAVALANNPPLLLADEPTGELDTNMAEEVFRMLQRINRQFGVTVIIVTHYAGIARWVDRVVRIRDGRIGSESYLRSSYRGGDGQEEEFLVVDRAGRLQLPREYVERLSLGGLATAGLAEDGSGITLTPASAPHRSRGVGEE